MEEIIFDFNNMGFEEFFNTHTLFVYLSGCVLTYIIHKGYSLKKSHKPNWDDIWSRLGFSIFSWISFFTLILLGFIFFLGYLEDLKDEGKFDFLKKLKFKAPKWL